MSARIAAVLLMAGLIGGATLLMHGGLYGLTLFILIPLLLGGVSCLAFRPETSGEAAGIGALTICVCLAGLVLAESEGMICIVMTAPLVVPLGAIGGVIVHSVGSSRVARPGAAMLLFIPGGLTWDMNAPPRVYEVHSSIEINATPEQVWKYVVAFPEITAPREWFFHTGLAYPTRTRIEGAGPGAARYCDLSTGTVAETVEVWDEPRMLRFRVTSTPPPMREMSIYSDVNPRHLHGYYISKEGEFRLTRLPGNRTLVEGTSWYQHGLWPSQYWRLWSDAVVHRIHMRVLNHIRALAERDGGMPVAAYCPERILSRSRQTGGTASAASSSSLIRSARLANQNTAKPSGTETTTSTRLPTRPAPSDATMTWLDSAITQPMTSDAAMIRLTLERRLRP